MKKQTRLTVILACMFHTLSGQAQARAADSMQMPMAAPFFVEDAFTHNELTIVANNSDPTDVEVFVADVSGKILCSLQKTVQAHGKLELLMGDALSQSGVPLPVQGSITIVPKQQVTVGAQLSIKRKVPWQLSDEELQEELTMIDPSLKNEFSSLGIAILSDPVISLQELI